MIKKVNFSLRVALYIESTFQACCLASSLWAKLPREDRTRV